MKLNTFIITVCAYLALILGVAEAKTRSIPNKPAKTKNSVPAECKVMVDSIQKLYDAGDPTYLTWNVSPECDSSLLYSAYFYQGVGFYLISSWKESLYFLTLANEIGGPKDEEVLFHLWNVNRKLNRHREMERATLELHHRYPNSFFLMEILDAWKAVKHPTEPWTFNYASKIDFSNNMYLNNVSSHRLRAGTHQKYGHHRFRETGSLTLKAKFPSPKLPQSNNLPSLISKRDSDTLDGVDGFAFQGLQANFGGEYEYKGFTFDLNYGIGYDSYSARGPLIFFNNGFNSRLLDSNWNWKQGRAALGYSLTTKSGWSLGWNINALQLSEDWRALGFSHTQSYLFPSWILLGYLDYQIHAPNQIYTHGDSTSPELDKLQTIVANITPYFSLGKHALGVGATYYQSISHYANTQFSSGFLLDEETEYSVSTTTSYEYEMRNWIKLNTDFSFGWEFSPKTSIASASTAKIYSMSLGLSLTF